jgi:hypothetical protein
LTGFIDDKSSWRDMTSKMENLYWKIQSIRRVILMLLFIYIGQKSGVFQVMDKDVLAMFF